MMSPLRLPVAALAATWSLVLTLAQTGLPDPAYRPAYPGSVLQMIADGTGRVVVANEASFNPAAPLVDQILPDGRRDPGFLATFSVSYIRALALCPDGRILVSHDRGPQDPVTDRSLWRLNSDGSVDATFQPDAVIPQYVEAILVQADGWIIVAGWNRYGMLDTPVLVRLQADGSLDPTFHADLPFFVNLLTPQPDGRILVAGSLSDTGGNSSDSHIHLVRLFADGSIDGSFTPTFDDTWGWATALVLQPDGRALMAGIIRAYSGTFFDYESRIIRLEADGRLDAGFQAERQTSGRTLALQGGGRIVIASTNHFYRLEPNGRLDATFGLAGDPESLVIDSGWTQSLQLLGDGSIMIAGSFQSYLGVTNGSVLRLQNDAGSGAGTLQWAASKVTAPEAAGVLRLELARLDGSRGEVTVNYATHGGSARPGQRYEAAHGVVHFADGEPGPRIVEIPLINDAVGQGSQTFLVSLANPIGGAILGSPAEVEVTVLDDDTSLRFPSPTLAVREEAGSVDLVIERGGLLEGTSSAQVQAAGGTARPGIDFQAEPARIEFAPGQSNAVYHVTLIDNTWAQGDRTFTVSLSDATGAVIEPEPLTVTIQDGDLPGRVDFLCDTSRSAWPPNRALHPWFLMPDADDSVLAAAAVYQGPLERTGLVRFRADGSLDPDFGLGRTELPPPSPDPITRMVRLSSGRLLAVKSTGEIVAVTSRGDLEPAFPKDLWAGWVNSALAAPGDRVLLQGNLYRKDNDQEQFAIVRLNPDGTRDESLRSPVFGPSPDSPNPALVNTVAWATDGKLLVGGAFTFVDGEPRSGLARVLADGRLDPTFVTVIENDVLGTRAAGDVRRMAVQADGRIYIAGQFNFVQGSPRRGLARLMPDGSLDSTFDPGTGFSLVFPLFEDFQGTIVCLQPADGGKLLVGGWFEIVQGQRASRLVRLNANGTLDQTFATFMLPPHDPRDMTEPPAVYSIAPALEGRVWIAGNFSTYDGLPRPGVARLNNGHRLQFGPVRPGGAGALELELWVPAPGAYELEASADLKHWAKIADRTFESVGVTTWVVTSDAGAGVRFYRVRVP
jgi:uncharacterized delta-60 repeat protein